jgi:hypothetical protein
VGPPAGPQGQGVPPPRDIRDLIAYYQADRATADRIRRWAADGRRQAWWREYSDVIPESADALFDYESGASVIRTYGPMVLPALLQTEAYATRLLTAILPQHAPAQISALVQVRLRRQKILVGEGGDVARLFAVIDEAAVRRAMNSGSTADGVAQLEHLREISHRPNISIRVLPFDAGLHAAVMGGFTVFQFSDDIDRDVVYLESRTADRFLEETSSVLDHLRLFDAVNGRALDNARSRDLLTRLVEAPHPAQEQK